MVNVPLLNSPGQTCALQARVSSEFPAQAFAAGQVLARVWFPPPHVTEQASNDDQLDHCAATKMKVRYIQHKRSPNRPKYILNLTFSLTAKLLNNNLGDMGA